MTIKKFPKNFFKSRKFFIETIGFCKNILLKNQSFINCKVVERVSVIVKLPMHVFWLDKMQLYKKQQDRFQIFFPR